MLHPSIRSRIINRFQGKRRNQVQDHGGTERLFQKLTPQMLVELLGNAESRPVGQSIPGEPLETTRKYKARKLLDDMEQKDWIITASPHEGGKGDVDREPDLNLHITLKIGRTSYHLRCKEEPVLHIIQITE